MTEIHSKPETAHTAGPWVIFSDRATRTLIVMPAMREGDIATVHFAKEPNKAKDAESDANAQLIVAAPDFLKAAELLEKAEEANANCDECDGEGAPELCPRCFPLFDDARIARRLAIAKAHP